MTLESIFYFLVYFFLIPLEHLILLPFSKIFYPFSSKKFIRFSLFILFFSPASLFFLSSFLLSFYIFLTIFSSFKDFFPMAIPSSTSIRNLNTPNKSLSFRPNDNKIDQFLRKIIFQSLERSTDQFLFQRATSLPTVAFFAQGASVNNNVAAVSTTTLTLERVGQHVAIDLLDELSSRSDYDLRFSQLEQQVRATKLSLLRLLSTKLITGGTGSNEVIGIQRQITTNSNGVDFSASNPLNLNDLYRAANACRPTDDFVGSYSGRCFVSNERALRQVMHLLDTAGLNLQFRYDEDLKTEIPFFFGIPWLISDAVPTTGGSPDTTDIYVVPLEGETALRLLYAKDMNHDCDEWGIHCYDIPLQQSTSQLSKAVVAFYTLYVPEASLVRMNTVRLSNATALP
jgi:hypothetical protein